MAGSPAILLRQCPAHEGLDVLDVRGLEELPDVVSVRGGRGTPISTPAVRAAVAVLRRGPGSTWARRRAAGTTQRREM